MSEELAYSIHLGSDKNKTTKAKKVAKNNPFGETSFANNGIQNATQLSKENKHNLRDYDNNKQTREDRKKDGYKKGMKSNLQSQKYLRKNRCNEYKMK